MAERIWTVQTFNTTMGKLVVSLFVFGSLERAERFIKSVNVDEHNHVAAPLVAAYDGLYYTEDAEANMMAHNDS